MIAVAHRHRSPRERVPGLVLAVALAVVLALSGCAVTGSADSSGARQLILASTTSAQNAGLLDALIPRADASTGCATKAVAVGSGHTLTMGERGDADVLLVHSPADEREFMAQGHGVTRHPVMHNDFVLIGPPGDPAGIAAARDPADALALLARREARFVSRGDGSGTHAKELALWRAADIEPAGGWHVETGQGMGETLTIASQQAAYTLTDRATFLVTKGLSAEILVDDDPELRNPYHVITVDDAANADCARAFAAWLRGEQAQRLIAEFGADSYPRQLLVPETRSR